MGKIAAPVCTQDVYMAPNTSSGFPMGINDVASSGWYIPQNLQGNELRTRRRTRSLST